MELSQQPERSSGARARVLGLFVAGLVAVVAALVAPSVWPQGPGSLELSWRGEIVAVSAVEVGSPEPVQVDGTAAGTTITLELASGVPADEATVGRVTVVEDGRRIRPALDAVTLALVTPDGHRHLIPVLTWDRTERELVVRRQPPDHAAAVLGLLGAAVVLWVTVGVPLFATALAIPVGLTVSGATSAQSALAPFFHPIIALFLGGFLLAAAMRRAGLDQWAARRIVSVAGKGPVGLLVGMMATAAFLSMWMSNTAAVAVLIPIALALGAPLGDPRYTKALVLGCAYAATIGGVGSAIGTPANLLAIEYLDAFDVRSITFAGWFAYGLPMVVLVLPVLALAMWRRYVAGVDRQLLVTATRNAHEQTHASRLSPQGRRVLAVFALIAAAWLLQGWHGVHPGIVALAGAVVLAVTGDIVSEDLGGLEWSTLLTFGAGLSLGLALTEAGVADWIAGRLGGLASLPDLVATAAVGAVALALTTVASNTASAATLIPLAVPVAAAVGVTPTSLVLVVAVASSIDFALIIGTPPTMLAYSTGLFRPAEILRAGAWLDLAALAVLVTIVVPFWATVGLT